MEKINITKEDLEKFTNEELIDKLLRAYDLINILNQVWEISD